MADCRSAEGQKGQKRQRLRDFNKINKIQTTYLKTVLLRISRKGETRVTRETRTEPVLEASGSQMRDSFSDPEILAPSRVDRGRSAASLRGAEFSVVDDGIRDRDCCSCCCKGSVLPLRCAYLSQNEPSSTSSTLRCLLYKGRRFSSENRTGISKEISAESNAVEIARIRDGRIDGRIEFPWIDVAREGIHKER